MQLATAQTVKYFPEHADWVIYLHFDFTLTLVLNIVLVLPKANTYLICLRTLL